VLALASDRLFHRACACKSRACTVDVINIAWLRQIRVSIRFLTL